MASYQAINDSKITLYTAQSMDAYESLVKNGILHGDRRHVSVGFGNAYNWMKKAMVRNGIHTDNFKDTYPVWAWYRFGGKKPDCRNSGLGTPKKRYAFLTLEVDSSRVLLSDFDLWHYVLNRWYICKSEEEDAKFEDTKYFNTHHKKTWDRCFDVFDKDMLSYYGITDENQFIQAVLWNITLDDVVSVKFFTAR